MELSLNIDVQQRFRLETQLSYASELRAFERFRPEVDIPPGEAWRCSMRSAFY